MRLLLTTCQEITEEDEDSQDPGSQPAPADLAPPVKSTSKKARNKAKKEAKKKGDK